MRIKPVHSRPAPLGSDFLALSSREQSPNQCGLPHRAQFKSIQLEPAVHELVERRVRSSLKLVRAGECTAQQALKAVVNRLADELTDCQYQNLIAYFKTKEIQGKLAPARQVLLRYLNSAKGCRILAQARDQKAHCDIENRATATATPALPTGSAVIGIADIGLKHIISPDCNSEPFDTTKQLQALSNKTGSTWGFTGSQHALYHLDF